VPLPYETGLHGFEIEGPDVSFRHPALETAPPVVRRLHEEAARALAWCEGLLVEDKIYSLVCDVRLVPLSDAFRAVSQFRALVEADVRAGLLKLTVSAHAIELLPPADWHKGRAVDWIREHVAARLGRPPVVVYLGDDRTDADAFGALVDNDLAIGVGSLPAARGLAHRLPGPMAVGRFLSRLAALRANASPIQ
jgi:trehalose 6-phosphate phosphatase